MEKRKIFIVITLLVLLILFFYITKKNPTSSTPSSSSNTSSPSVANEEINLLKDGQKKPLPPIELKDVKKIDSGSTPNEKTLNVEMSEEGKELKKNLVDILKIDWKERSVDDLNESISRILTSQSMTRDQKIEILWSILNGQSINDAEFGYILDNLSSLKPVELVNDLITFYSSASELKKQSIISSFRGLTLLDPEQEYSEEDFKKNEAASIQISGFLSDEINSNSSKPILKELIKTYTSISSAEDVLLVIENLYDSKVIDRKSTNDILLEVVFEDNESQDLIISKLLNDPENLDDIEFMNKLNIMVNDVGVGELTETTKSRINKNTDGLNLKKNSDESVSMEVQSSFMEVINTKVLLDESSDDKDKLMADYAMNNFLNEDKHLEISTIVALSSEKTLGLLRERKTEILPILEASLENYLNIPDSESDIELIKGAIEALE